MSQEKPFHILIQVLNFLRKSDFTSAERLVLIEIATHFLKSYTPGIDEISRNTGLSERWVMKTLSSLEKKSILEIKKISGLRNKYSINLNLKLSTTPELSSPLNSVHPCTQFTGTPELSSRVPLNSVHPTPELSSPHIVNNNKYNKKEREPAPASRLPLSDFCIKTYRPNNDLIKIATKRGLDPEVVIKKFVNHMIINKIDSESQDVSDRRFENYMYSERPGSSIQLYGINKNINAITANTTYSGMRDFTQERIDREMEDKKPMDKLQ